MARTREGWLTDVDLSKLKNAPTDEEIIKQTSEARTSVRLTFSPSHFYDRWNFVDKIAKTLNYLEPLRSGTSTLLTQEEVAQLDADWLKWRAEWIKRRKAFYS